MKFLIFILPFIFAFISGLFKAVQDSRSDTPKEINMLYDYIAKKGSEYINWWDGGNNKYPPGNPFKCDLWHFGGHVRTFCFSGAVLSAVLTTLLYPSLWETLYGFCYGIIGITFTFFYSYVFRKDHNFKWYLNHLKNIWKKHN